MLCDIKINSTEHLNTGCMIYVSIIEIAKEKQLNNNGYIIHECFFCQNIDSTFD